jgi:hypothetical protein
MRRHLGLGVILLLVATTAALVLGLVEEMRKLSLLTEAVAKSDCIQLGAEFSQVSFTGYHLALSMVIMAGVVFLGSIALLAAYRWLARRIFEQLS